MSLWWLLCLGVLSGLFFELHSLPALSRCLAVRSGSLFIHALLDKSLGIQFFGHFYRELQVLADEGFESLRALKLPLFLIEDVVVVFYHFFH